MLGACTNVNEHWNAYNANSPALAQKGVEEFVEAQTAIFEQFSELAGVDLDEDDTELRPIVDAGIHYVDVRCSGYMQAVFWLNRAKNAASRQTQLFGSASGAALEVVSASRQLVGLTPLGFTLVNDTIQNAGNSLLFSLPPEVVGRMVEDRQRAYVSALPDSYKSRAAAMRAIQGYVELCLSNNIEAAAIEAIAASRAEPEPPPAAADGAGDRADDGADDGAVDGAVDGAADGAAADDDGAGAGDGAAGDGAADGAATPDLDSIPQPDATGNTYPTDWVPSLRPA